MTRLRVVVALAVLALAACRTGRAPYAAPPPAGPPALDRYAAARLRVLVEEGSDDRVTPPWRETAARAADAVAAALGEAGFHVTRGLSFFGWDARVIVRAPLRGPDLSVVADANGKVVARLDANGASWSKEELAALGRAVRERLVGSEEIAALAGVPPRGDAPAAAAAQPEPSAATTAAAGPSAAPAAPAAPGAAAPPLAAGATARRTLVVSDFRGSGPAEVRALLADQVRAVAAEAGRTTGTTVLSRELVAASLGAKARAAGPCADAGCDLETARAVHADLLVTGEVSAVGTARVLVLSLVDAASGALVASRQVQAADDLSLLEAAKPAAAALLR